MKAQDYIIAARALRIDEWDESLHPRAENGQFGAGSGEPVETVLPKYLRMSQEDFKAAVRSKGLERDTFEKMRTAYTKLSQQLKTPHVPISALHKAVGEPPVEQFKQYLMKLSAARAAYPTIGEQAHATTEEKATSINLRTGPTVTRHMLITILNPLEDE